MGPREQVRRERDPVVIRPWQVVFVLVWGAGAVSLGVSTYVVDDLRICSTETVERPASSDTETSRVEVRGPRRRGPTADPGSVTTNVTRRPASKVTTTTCGGLPLPALALLLLPALAALLPSLKSLDVGGVLGVTFRDVKEKLDLVEKGVTEVKVAQQTLLQVGLNLKVVQVAGDYVSPGLDQWADGQVVRYSEVVR